MRALSICMGLLLSMGLLAGNSNANITVSKTNSTVATVSSGGSGGFPATAVRSVSFSSADFASHPTADIISIDVAVTFRKLRGTQPLDLNPFYNEISMVFGKTEVGNTTLIGAGPIGGDDDSFNLGVSAPGAGFNGTVTFSSRVEAALPVNRAPNQDNIPTAGVFRPANTVALSTPWTTFVGQSAIGTFNLNLADIDGGVDTSVDPLEFVSMTVTINAVPEPSSFGLCGLLTLGGAFIRRRVRG